MGKGDKVIDGTSSSEEARGGGRWSEKKMKGVLDALLEGGYITEAASKQALFTASFTRDAQQEFMRQFNASATREGPRVVFDEPVQYENKSERFVIEVRASKATDMMCDKMKLVVENAVKCVRLLDWPHYNTIYVRVVYLPVIDAYGEHTDVYRVACLYNYYAI